MTIEKLIIENFKGISSKEEFEIRPLTIFCGPNSSGKSSCIHALAALAQTTKLSATQLPIVLDDEYAQVHLGRFVDVIHSRNIRDSFRIGLSTSNQNQKKFNNNATLEFQFKAKAATQEVYISSAQIKTNKEVYSFKRENIKNQHFKVTRNTDKSVFRGINHNRFDITIDIAFEKNKWSENEFQAYRTTNKVFYDLNQALRDTIYLGPFRQAPLRKYPTRGSQPTEVGAAGESTVTMLANEFVRSKTKHPRLVQVSTWMKNLGLGEKISVTPISKTDLFDVSITLTDGAQIPLPDLGFGVSQVLPVLTQCAFAPNNSTLLFEQPELHLHDSAAKELAGVFIDVIKDKSVQIIAETHSRHLFHEVIQQVKNKRISANDVVLYDVVRKDGASYFKKINLIYDSKDNSCEVDHPWGKNL